MYGGRRKKKGVSGVDWEEGRERERRNGWRHFSYGPLFNHMLQYDVILTERPHLYGTRLRYIQYVIDNSPAAVHKYI